MKEEGEITDDEDDTEVPLTDRKPPLREFNRKRKRSGDSVRQLVSWRHDKQKSYRSLKFRGSSSDNTPSTAVSEPYASAAKNTHLPDLETRLSTRPYTPPLTPSSSYFRLSVSQSRSESPSVCKSCLQVEKNTANGGLSVEKSWHMPCSQPFRSYKVSDSSESEVITIDDSEADISDEGLIFDEDDLDELQLRHEAMMSLLGAERLPRSDYIAVYSSSDEQHLADIEHDNSVPLNTEMKQDAADSIRIGEVAVPASTSSEVAIFSSEDCTFHEQSTVISSHGLFMTSTVTDATYTNSVPVQNLTLPNDQGVILQQLDIDNYDDVEMDLDSESDSETHILSSCEHVLQPFESVSDAADQNFAHIPSTCTSSQASLNTSAATAVSHTLSSFSDSAITQPFSATVDSSNVNISQNSEDTIYDTSAPALLYMKTKIVDPGSPQQQRKVKDADEKLELLLRAEVLRSLSSNRQQQQQLSHLDMTSSIPRDRLQAIKRTITSTSVTGNQNQLPIHQPVVISLSAESSDSDDTEQPETAASFVHSSTASSDLSTNLDRVLHEIRKAHDTTASESEAAPPVKYLGKHSISEPALANQYMPSNNACSLPFSSHHQLVLGKSPVTSYSTGMAGVSSKLDAAETSLQKLLLGSLAREKRKLQQQKISLNKAKLKMARKKEQVDVADKRVKKLQEQLQAAEKIALSSRKQLHSLQEETLTLSSGIEQHQNAIRKLQLRLSVAQKIPTSSANEYGSDSENLHSEILFSNQQSSGTKSCKSSANTVERTTNSSHVPSVIQHQASVTFTVASSVASPSLSTSQIPHSTVGNKLCSTQQSQEQSSTESQVSHTLKRLRHPNVKGRESAITLVQDNFVKKEPTFRTEHRDIESSQTTEQQVKPPFPDVNREHSVSNDQDPNVCANIKPSLLVTKSDKPSVQKTSGPPNDEFAVSSDRTSSIHSSSEFVMPSDKKISQILHHYNNTLERNSALSLPAPFCQLFVSDPVFSFQFSVSSSLPVASSFLTADSKSDAFHIGCPFKSYHSSLLCFRSYIFSDFFQQKGLSLSSETYAHKLDCHVPLCQFDLMGKCLDEGCALQHRSDYTLTKKEQLVDIVSYCPSVAGADSSISTSKCEQLVQQYVEKFSKDVGMQLSHSERCRCLIDRVKMAAGLVHPHAVCTSARRWKLHGRKQHICVSNKSDLLFGLDDVSEIPESAVGGSLIVHDVRYWMAAELEQTRKLEEAVAATPNDESSWIKLAYAKMTEMRWSASHDECISYGLNVLARAVEASPSSSNLWTHYLDLYMSRSHAGKDASSLYEQAVQYAPSYVFFWKYLQLSVSYSQKMDICKRLRQFLCSPRCPDGADKRSHHLLETVLYQASLCTMSGRFKDGLQVMQAIVQSKASVIWLALTSCDRVIMWLSFIHLYECQQLPKTLFDPSNSNPGPIVQKEPFIVPFKIGKKTRISYETLLQLFGCAFSACKKDIKPGSLDSHGEYLRWLGALHRSQILLELSCRGWAATHRLSEQFLQQRPYLLDVWFLYIQLIIASSNTPDRQTLTSSVSDTVEKALTSNPHSVPLFLAGICALVECGETESALIFAERCSISLFEVGHLDSSIVDPNLLYCCLLRQPLPLNYRVPALHSSVSWQYIADQQANLWLSYCLLLDLQGAHDQAFEAYHTALSCLIKTKDIQRLLIACLRRNAAVMSDQLPWLTHAGGPDERKKLWQEFESEIERALFSVLVRRSLPHSSQTWDDYSSHNEIIKLHLSCLSDVDQVRHLYEKYLIQMPANVDLVLDYVNWLLGRDAVHLAQGLCLMALHSCPRSAALWNILLRLCQRTSDASLMRAVHSTSSRVLPFSANLCKLYIMFEVINKSLGCVQEATESCRRLQVNVDGFVNSLLK